ncbi:MAG: outer membrane beta-barrel protein [Bacteroidota bacterium]
MIIFFLSSFSGFSQYWFGPKVGLNYINHVYQENTYESDSFNVPKNFNFHAGMAFSYTASDMYAVYGELFYERIGKKVRDKQTDGQLVRTEMTNHFISAPVMLRITLGRLPVRYYLNAGPRLSYWVAGSGKRDLDEFEEFLEVDEVDYKITFNSSKANEADLGRALVSQPNRLQFGLTAGVGMILELIGEKRLQLDFRYTWVHSNMGTNNGEDDVNFNNVTHQENFEYFHNIATVGVAYLFGYNSKLRRKGKSTNKKSNKKKK